MATPTQNVGARSGTAASDLYNQQRSATAQTIADILAQGDALKGGLTSSAGGGYYTGGSPGYTVDNRGAVNASYNTIRGDVGNVFGQAVAAVNAQNPQIQADAANRQNMISALLASQNQAASAAGAQQLSDQQLAAQRMGLAVTPQTSRANATANVLAAYRGAGAGLQKNYFGALGKFALDRNQAAAGAFSYANDEQQKKIEQARQAALAKAFYFVPGSRGRYVKNSSTAQGKADKKTISAITKEQKAITSAQNKDTAQRAKDASIRQNAVQANRRLT